MKKLTVLLPLIVLLALNIQVFPQKRKTSPPKSKTITATAPKSTQTIAKKDFFGFVEGNAYKNKFFGLKLTIPENWLIQESQFNTELKRIGSEMVTAKNAATQKAFDEAMQQVVILLSGSKDIVGMENNALMVFSAEKKSPLLQIRNGEDYLRLTIQSFKKIRLPADFKYSENIESENFGGETFYSLDVGRDNYKQRLYATYRKGYTLFFTLVYFNENDLETIKEALRKSDFSWNG